MSKVIHYRRPYKRNTACEIPHLPGRYDGPHPLVQVETNSVVYTCITCSACLMSLQFEDDTYLLEIGCDGDLQEFEDSFEPGEHEISE